MAQHEHDETRDQAAPDKARRSFLRAAGGAGALGVLAAAASGAAEAAPAAPPAAAAPQAKGYRETEHIQKYYRTARYW